MISALGLLRFRSWVASGFLLVLILAAAPAQAADLRIKISKYAQGNARPATQPRRA